MIVESLLGSVLGGVFRLAPEILKLLDRKNERDHEARMMDREMALAQLRAEQAMHSVDAGVQVAQFDAMAEALRGQTAMATAGGKAISVVSALVRPLVTYWFVVLYTAHKVALLWMAYEQRGDWRSVLSETWTAQDWAILSMILTFWFVGRAWESRNSK